mmetsp:Transcript_22377/g.42187  ORF Transcript_22377/g.42187 Transcript_22377/m.42187 type:complete len:158 (-) Transcript_22377:256-729(-)
MEEKPVDVWSQEAYQSNYRLAYNHPVEDFPYRVQAANAARLILKSAGDPGEKLHFGNWPAKDVPDGSEASEVPQRYVAKSLIKHSTYRADYRHGQPQELDPHVASFRPVALPDSTWKTELWISDLSKNIWGNPVCSPTSPVRSVYQEHFTDGKPAAE